MIIADVENRNYCRIKDLLPGEVFCFLDDDTTFYMQTMKKDCIVDIEDGCVYGSRDLLNYTDNTFIKKYCAEVTLTEI